LVRLRHTVKEYLVQAGKNTRRVPVPQTSPAGHAAAVPELVWKVFPADARLEDVQDAVQGSPIRHPGPAASGLRDFRWEQRLDQLPQLIADQ
jgi:hypothetical protein